jgi:hypothetical protein
MTMQDDKKKNKHGCFWFIVIVFGFFLAIWAIGGGSSSSTENYNDNSTTHQILAKNYFKDYLKDNLKNAKSYEEVNYTSSYNSSKGCYEVTLKYRATNSFGAMVVEQASGDVYFSDDRVSIRNVRTE